MPQAKTLAAAQTVTGPGPWHNMNPDFANRGFVVSVAGGTPTASVTIEVSNDGGVTFATRVTFAAVSGSDADVDANQPFPLVRHNVTALGAGAAVTTTVCAA